MSDHHRERDEKQNEGNQPENHMTGSSLGSGAEEIQHNDKQNLCQDEVEQPKLFA